MRAIFSIYPSASFQFGAALSQLIALAAAASIACAVSTARASTEQSDITQHEAPEGAFVRLYRSIAPRVERAIELASAALQPIGSPDGAIASRIGVQATLPRIGGSGSMYNPTRHDDASGGLETASGETYNADAWTAAIQIGLRSMFSGVRYGRQYRPAFALVSTAEKSVIVRINDVGPLLPGRVIDLTERAMRYFDETLQQGLVRVQVIPLRGTSWRPGPLQGGPALPMAGELSDKAIRYE